jgi:histidyl-tRNA synthetase
MLPDYPEIPQLSRGVRIITGEAARLRRLLLNGLIAIAEGAGFQEIILPTIEPAAVYSDKAGTEILGQMYTFPDRKGRQLCLRPEGTATIQLLAETHLKGREKDAKLWYFERCYRYERPQAGRYREFYQFGVEWLYPRDPEVARASLVELACRMVRLQTSDFVVNGSVKRGLAYYVDNGFEIEIPSLGAQKQVCGGGTYAQGLGFGLGFDRLVLVPRG